MKSQISMELLIYTSLLLVFFGLMAFSSSSLHSQVDETRVFSEAKKVLDGVAFEISLASRAGSGYSRKFFIPDKIDGEDFNLTVKNYYLTLTFPRGSFVAPLSVKEIDGNLSKGFNLIKNINGVIYVESSNP